ncbi:hypothetical protein ACFQWF_14720 [Methylorubrum suomiense]
MEPPNRGEVTVCVPDPAVVVAMAVPPCVAERLKVFALALTTK